MGSLRSNPRFQKILAAPEPKDRLLRRTPWAARSTATLSSRSRMCFSLTSLVYSKLLTNEQRERLQELNRIVRETEHFRVAEAAGKLVRIPTGDGMVLAFFTSPDAPVRCAVAVSRALRGMTHLPLRMGIHSGPVDLVEDVNDKQTWRVQA